jgi:hypothetical protein
VSGAVTVIPARAASASIGEEAVIYYYNNAVHTTIVSAYKCGAYGRVMPGEETSYHSEIAYVCVPLPKHPGGRNTIRRPISITAHIAFRP